MDAIGVYTSLNESGRNRVVGDNQIITWRDHLAACTPWKDTMNIASLQRLPDSFVDDRFLLGTIFQCPPASITY